MTDSPYSAIRHQQISAFSGEFSGSEEALFCVVSSKPLSSQAHDALVASAQSLGYHACQLAFITLTTQADTASALSTQPKDLFLVLEAVDPFAIVLTDHHAVEVASSAYNVPLTLEQRAVALEKWYSCLKSYIFTRESLS